MPSPTRLTALLACLLALSACKLIDQRTFAPTPEASTPKAPASAAAVRTETRTPLMTVAAGTRLATYETLLRSAVHAAEARDPEVRFDVVSVVPASGTVTEQIKVAQAARDSAAELAHALIAAGASASHVHQGARADPAAHDAEVRVYVR
jgi:hypothetical protein